jgi:hypothetical protein
MCLFNQLPISTPSYPYYSCWIACYNFLFHTLSKKKKKKKTFDYLMQSNFHILNFVTTCLQYSFELEFELLL